MRKLSIYLGLFLVSLPFFSCSDDDAAEDEMLFMGATQSYALMARADATISGTATFMENEDGSATVVLDLNGTTSGMSPAHIHFNSAAEGGDIAVSLEPVEGSTGMSTTLVTMLDDGTAITYRQLLEFDGYINVHRSADDLSTLIAQGDIGVNELTGESKTYALGSKDVDGISGTATFSERVSGKALAVIELQGTPDDGMHPGHIHLNTAAEGGAIAFTFNPVVGATGRSETSVEALDDGTSISYAQLLEFDGYINIHLSADDLATLVAQGDIGQNEKTGESKLFPLVSVSDPTIFGTALFEERVNAETLVTIVLEGTRSGMTHPAHIHEGSVAEAPGAILIGLGEVSGETGLQLKNVSMLDDGTAITYDQMTAIDGYINVHLSANDLATLVAQGNVGINAE